MTPVLATTITTTTSREFAAKRPAECVAVPNLGGSWRFFLECLASLWQMIWEWLTNLAKNLATRRWKELQPWWLPPRQRQTLVLHVFTMLDATDCATYVWQCEMITRETVVQWVIFLHCHVQWKCISESPSNPTRKVCGLRPTIGRNAWLKNGYHPWN